MALIVEIMLMSEGFNMSKMLSRKFVILYRLCEDLLSKSKHYDWKLRAIKTTLYVAGGMKRSAPDLSEDKVKPLMLACMLAIVSLFVYKSEPVRIKVLPVEQLLSESRVKVHAFEKACVYKLRLVPHS